MLLGREWIKEMNLLPKLCIEKLGKEKEGIYYLDTNKIEEEIFNTFP